MSRRPAPTLEPGPVLKSLADPTRRAIFERLSRDGELTVHALAAPSGVSQPAISKHLGALKLSGLVRGRRQGRQTFYRAEPGGLAPLIGWMTSYGKSRRERMRLRERRR